MTVRYDRIFEAPKGSYFLLGPRGTGKSLFLRKHYPDAEYKDLLDQSKFQHYLAKPGDFYDELQHLPAGSRVVVDEVQRLPALLNEVHRLIENHGLLFTLSGSSARKLRQAGVNLLAGRALRRTMHPFVPEELGGDFDLERALTTGCLPVVWDSQSPEETLQAYVQLYLKEEIQAEAVVRNLPGFARFLPISALFHGQVINISGVAQQAEVARTTTEGFFRILEDTLVGMFLPAYEAKLRVRERKKPKFYLVDAGLVRAIKGVRGPPSPEERGHLFEGFLAQTLRAYKEYRSLFDEMSYWAPLDAKHVEVDFILAQGPDLIAIECKSSDRVDQRDLSGLKAIAELAGVRRRLLVYPGKSRRTHDGIEIVPLADLLELLESGTI